MCLAIPAQICERVEGQPSLAVVDVLGVRRRVSLDLLIDDPPQTGDWVLIHVGFAMSRISDLQARETLAMLEAMGETPDAQQELREGIDDSDGEAE